MVDDHSRVIISPNTLRRTEEVADVIGNRFEAKSQPQLKFWLNGLAPQRDSRRLLSCGIGICSVRSTSAPAYGMGPFASCAGDGPTDGRTDRRTNNLYPRRTGRTDADALGLPISVLAYVRRKLFHIYGRLRSMKSNVLTTIVIDACIRCSTTIHNRVNFTDIKTTMTSRQELALFWIPDSGFQVGG